MQLATRGLYSAPKQITPFEGWRVATSGPLLQGPCAGVTNKYLETTTCPLVLSQSCQLPGRNPRKETVVAIAAGQFRDRIHFSPLEVREWEERSGFTVSSATNWFCQLGKAQLLKASSLIWRTRAISPDQWFSKCGPEPPAAAPRLGTGLKSDLLGPTSHPLNQTPGWGPAICNLPSPALQVILIHTKLETHWPR